MQSKFIRVRELASAPGRNGAPARHGRLPVSHATIWRWVKLGEFPPPVRLGPQTTAWRMEDIERWEAEHAAQLQDGQHRPRRHHANASKATQPLGRVISRHHSQR
jgi:predicted DNA-binding transcriptional regulator AlpA